MVWHKTNADENDNIAIKLLDIQPVQDGYLAVGSVSGTGASGALDAGYTVLRINTQGVVLARERVGEEIRCLESTADGGIIAAGINERLNVCVFRLSPALN
jgi:hypothetical protein